MLSSVLATDTALLAGFLLVGLVIVRGSVSCRDAFRRTRANRETATLELDRLRTLVAREALSFQKQKEENDLSWGGVRKFQVQEVVSDENEDGDIASFYLVPHDERPLPLYRPGQFLTFLLRMPGKTRPVIRCYSLSDAPRRDRYRITIKRVPNGLSERQSGKRGSERNPGVAVRTVISESKASTPAPRNCARLSRGASSITLANARTTFVERENALGRSGGGSCMVVPPSV